MSWGAASNSDLPSRELRRMQRAIGGVVLVLMLLLAARLWLIEGLLFPVHIAGASMADTLLGAHASLTCADCGCEYHCDLQGSPSDQFVPCPNCGYTQNELTAASLRAPNQVLVDRWVYLLGRPERGDVVAFTHPDEENVPRVVKRIVGLPGEHVAIRRGDVIIDGQPWRKTLAEFREIAIPVHDQRLLPRQTKNPTPHWQPESKQSHWVEHDGAFIYSGKRPPEGRNFDWLSFRYHRRLAAPMPHDRVMPVQDDDTFNHGGPRELNDVHDLLLSCRASIAKYGCLVFAAVDGTDRFEVHMCHDEHKLKLFQNGEQQMVEFLPHRQYDEPINIEFAICDQQVLFGMDGREILRYPYQRKHEQAKQQEPQLQIGGAGGRIRISQARVARDIYYLNPDNIATDWHEDDHVSAGSYFVLGDNPTVSVDSRTWVHAGVPFSRILGRVSQPFWVRQ